MRILFRALGYGIGAALFAVGLIKPDAGAAQNKSSTEPFEASAEPDLPTGFGYKLTWFAIRTEDTKAVADAFSLHERKDANWASGFRFSDDIDGQFGSKGKPVFIAPPVNGWTLVLGGLNFGADSSDAIEELRTRLKLLSKQFGEAQYFGSYRVVDYVAWYKASAGEVTRGFSYADGTVFENDGITSKAEISIGYFDMSGMNEETFWERVFAEEEKDRYFFDEEDPMKIGGKWSINPLLIEQVEGLKPSTGIIGLVVN